MHTISLLEPREVSNGKIERHLYGSEEEDDAEVPTCHTIGLQGSKTEGDGKGCSRKNRERVALPSAASLYPAATVGDSSTFGQKTGKTRRTESNTKTNILKLDALSSPMEGHWKLVVGCSRSTRRATISSSNVVQLLFTIPSSICDPNQCTSGLLRDSETSNEEIDKIILPCTQDPLPVWYNFWIFTLCKGPYFKIEATKEPWPNGGGSSST
ncbi:hypothetical protein FB45DRAFT_873129 [Roridomyces roridus]|uniref:Uncharacterized protein n=1 Tax=Roridomyces roridus TaxID=1738132 RepID=A0AAD7BAS1_9AGAR|nr:hypothetical protein FB45DRAFT_873129 [Roridomyces roridus]